MAKPGDSSSAKRPVEVPSTAGTTVESTELHDAGDAVAFAWLQHTKASSRRTAAYARCVTSDPDEIADLLADAVASAWCERDLSSNALYDDSLLMRAVRVAGARWMALHRYELQPRLPECLEMPADFQADADANAARAEAFSWAKDRLWELPKQQRHAVWFRALGEFSFKELAVVLSCSTSAAKTHYRRGLSRLRKQAAQLRFELRDGL